MSNRPTYLIGSSKDIHRLIDGDGFVLCQTKIEANKSIKAHSDGDVALHAIGEAIFLALGENDLGDQFPTKGSNTLDMNSSKIIKKALDDASNRGYEISNVTLKIFLERPKLYVHKAMMKEKLCHLLNLPSDRVGLALGTYEGLGSVGKEKAIECMASVMLKSKEEI